MIIDIALLISGFALVIWSSHKLLNNIITISIASGISLLFISFTIGSLTTSLPEVFISIVGIKNNLPETLVGNVIGSNITNITLCLGTALMFTTIDKSLRPFPATMTMFISSLLFAYVSLYEQSLSIYFSMLFLIILSGITVYTYLQQTKKKKEKKQTHSIDYPKILAAFMAILTAAIILWIGSSIVINAGKNISVKLNIEYSLVSVILLSLGTSLPEFTMTILAASRKKNKIIIGNIIGSNTINPLLIGGICGIFFDIPIPRATWLYDLISMLIITSIFFFIFAIKQDPIGKREGLTLLSMYVIYAITRTII